MFFQWIQSPSDCFEVPRQVEATEALSLEAKPVSFVLPTAFVQSAFLEAEVSSFISFLTFLDFHMFLLFASIGIIGYCIRSILPAQFVYTHSYYSHPFADLPIFNVSFLPPWTCLNESLHTSQEFGWASMCSRPFRPIFMGFFGSLSLEISKKNCHFIIILLSFGVNIILSFFINIVFNHLGLSFPYHFFWQWLCTFLIVSISILLDILIRWSFT